VAQERSTTQQSAIHHMFLEQACLSHFGLFPPADKLSKQTDFF